MTGGPLVAFAVGLPATGKTSFFRQLAARLPKACIVSSEEIRKSIKAFNLTSPIERRRTTAVAADRLARALEGGFSYVLVDMNLLVKSQRGELLAVVQGRSARSVLFRFEGEREVILDGIRHKLGNSQEYRQTSPPAEDYLDAVQRLLEPVGADELFDAVVDLQVRSRKVLGDLFGVDEDLGDCVADLLDSYRMRGGMVSNSLWEHVRSERVVLRTPKFDVIEADVVTREGRPEVRVYARKGDFVGIIAVDDEGNVLLTREFRSASGSMAWGIPGGARERGEPVAAAARREFLEETGYSALSMSLFYSEPTVSSSVMETNWIFVGRRCVKVATGSPTDSHIETFWVPTSEV